MDALENLPPAVLLVLALLLLVWLVLLLLVPFMIESIRSSTRKTYFELQEVNRKLERLIILIDEHERDVAMRIDGLRATDYDPRAREARVRKEPTI